MKNILKECTDNRFYSFGTAKLFERRAKVLRRRRAVITFLGLAVPLVVGAAALSFSTESAIFQTVMLPTAGFLTTAQLVISLWALVSRWDEKNDYAVAAVKTNTRLEAEFNRLCNSADNFHETEYVRLRDEYLRIQQEDTAHGVSEEEKKYGMRKALIHYQLACPTCKVKPNSSTPSKCDTCGNFPRRYS